jgi:cytochrome c-type biogenesis protein CcmH/NrfG
VQSASKACELSAWKDVECLFTLAIVHSSLGDFDAALGALEKAVSLLNAGDRRIEVCREMQASYRQRKQYQ